MIEKERVTGHTAGTGCWQEKAKKRKETDQTRGINVELALENFQCYDP